MNEYTQFYMDVYVYIYNGYMDYIKPTSYRQDAHPSRQSVLPLCLRTTRVVFHQTTNGLVGTFERMYIG